MATVMAIPGTMYPCVNRKIMVLLNCLTIRLPWPPAIIRATLPPPIHNTFFLPTFFLWRCMFSPTPSLHQRTCCGCPPAKHPSTVWSVSLSSPYLVRRVAWGGYYQLVIVSLLWFMCKEFPLCVSIWQLRKCRRWSFYLKGLGYCVI